MQTKAQYLEFASLNLHTKRLKAEMDSLFPGGWTVEDLAEHLCLKKTGKHLNELDSPVEPKPVEVTPHIEESPPEANQGIPGVTPKDIEERYREYLTYFKPDAPNDEHDLRIMVEEELTLRHLHARRLRMLETNARAADLKSIFEAITKVSEDYGRIQKRLGIDRLSRGSGKDAGDKLQDYITNAREVLHRQGIPILCTNCYRSDAKIVNLLGFLVWHFQDEDIEFRFEFTCPRCKTKMAYTKENLKDLKAIAGWT